MRSSYLPVWCVGLTLLLACGGEDEPTGTDPSARQSVSGLWIYEGYDIEGGRFKCQRAALALDLHSRITSFQGIASGVGTSCEDKLEWSQWRLSLGPLGSDTVKGSLSRDVIRFDIPSGGSMARSVVWHNDGIVKGDSMFGDLTILFTYSDGTRQSVTGKWKAGRR
jgi:hypothetical protein